MSLHVAETLFHFWCGYHPFPINMFSLLKISNWVALSAPVWFSPVWFSHTGNLRKEKVRNLVVYLFQIIRLVENLMYLHRRLNHATTRIYDNLQPCSMNHRTDIFPTSSTTQHYTPGRSPPKSLTFGYPCSARKWLQPFHPFREYNALATK